MKKFRTYEDYERWTEKFENTSDYENIPVAIDDGFKISMDALRIRPDGNLLGRTIRRKLKRTVRKAPIAGELRKAMMATGIYF